MAENLTVSGTHPLGERYAGVPARLEEAVPANSFARKVEFRWASEDEVTPHGQPLLGVDFPKKADLFDPVVREAPLQKSSPNAPRVRDALGGCRWCRGRADTCTSTRCARTGST